MLTILLSSALVAGTVVPITPDSPEPGAYTEPTTGVILDAVTGLEWQRDSWASPLDWTAARDHCAALKLSGSDDWRLPSASELLSIVKLSTANPATDTTAFPGTPADLFWSNTSYAGDSNYRWTVSFAEGHLGPVLISDAAYVRCVRTGGRS